MTGEADVTILVVDDDDAVRRILRKLLESRYRVLDTGHPLQACDIFAADPAAIDLLLTDLKMPRMSGQQLAERLWAKRLALPVLFISGYTDRAYSEELNGPNSHFLEKPFASELLLQHIAELLAVAAAGRQ